MLTDCGSPQLLPKNDIAMETEIKIPASAILLYGVIFLGLTGVAIWDVKNIVTSFLTDNQVTAVRVKKITNRVPFVSNKTRIHLSYDQPMFPGWIWPANSVTPIENILALNKTLHWVIEGFSGNRSNTDKRPLTLDEVFHIGAICGFVRSRQATGGSQLIDEGNRMIVQYFNRIDIDAGTSLDSFILYPGSIDLVHEAWDYIRPYFITVFDDVTPDSLAIIISLYDDLVKGENQDSAGVTYDFDFSGSATNISMKKRLSLPALTYRCLGGL